MNPAVWTWVVPLVGTLVMAAVPLVQHVQKTRTESAAVAVLARVVMAQEAFRAAHADAGYAATFDSLTAPCAGTAAPTPPLGPLEVTGYGVTLRAAADAVSRGLDCHGRHLASDYYAAISPQSDGSFGQQAFAVTGTGRIFVFFDGIAPLERDMAEGGLATPVESLDAFKIP